MIIISDIKQGSDAWFVEKAGKPSASNADKIITTTGKPSSQSEGYINQLVAEQLMGRIEEGYRSSAMLAGSEREEESLAFYELITGSKVQRIGMVYKNEQKNCLCSPDGLIDLKKGLELKNPLPKTQVKYLRKGKLPTEYFTQVQFSMWICDFSEWDFLSYVPCLPELFITVKRDDDFISKLETEMIKFLRELKEVYEKLKEKAC